MDQRQLPILKHPTTNLTAKFSNFIFHFSFLFFIFVSKFSRKRENDERGFRFRFKMEMSALFSYHLPHHFSATHFRSFSFLLYLQLFLLYLFLFLQFFLFHGWSDVICCCLIFYFIFIKSWFLIKPTLFGRLESWKKPHPLRLYSCFQWLKLFVCLFYLFYFLIDLTIHGAVLFSLWSIPWFPLKPTLFGYLESVGKPYLIANLQD